MLKRVLLPMSAVAGTSAIAYYRLKYSAKFNHHLQHEQHEQQHQQQQHHQQETQETKQQKYSREELAEHDGNNNSRIWVSYKKQVYDITDFVDAHPGSKQKILMGAGGAIDDHWKIWVCHTEKGPEKNLGLNVLKKYYIGELVDDDEDDEEDEEDVWNNEPDRSKRIPICEPGRTSRPFRGECTISDMFITPNDMHFIRNHAPTPGRCKPHLSVEVDLPISITNPTPLFRPISFNEETLHALPKVKNLPVTLQCSGNRLGESGRALVANNLYDKFSDYAWSGHGLISTATWGGVRMSELLKSAGITQQLLDYCDNIIQITDGKKGDGSEDDIWWVEMYGSEGYSNAIPLSLALDSSRDVLVAFEMNGEPLTRDHGNPLRVVVPGVAGAKSVKWLNRLVVKKKSECESPWFNKIYRDPPHGGHVLEWPVQSFIQDIQYTDEDGAVKLGGFAYSGGGRSIDRVEVSLDNGLTWTLRADLLNSRDMQKQIGKVVEEEAPGHYSNSSSVSSLVSSESDGQSEVKYNWAWTKWSVVLSKEQQAQLSQLQGGNNDTAEDKDDGKEGKVFICCRAVDSSGDVQPNTTDEALKNHPSGYFFNPVFRAQFTPLAAPAHKESASTMVK